MNNAESYPLSWPTGWTRNKHPGSSQFKASLSGALKNVNKSIDLFAKDSGHKVENIVISSNVTLSAQRPKEAGVAIYFSWNGISTCIAVDRYTKVEDNLQAIHHCIEAERTKLRHGGINLVTAAFRGYAALPPASQFDGDWWVILETNQYAAPEIVKKNYQKLRSKYHPDKPTGDKVKFNAVKKAWDKHNELRGAP